MTCLGTNHLIRVFAMGLALCVCLAAAPALAQKQLSAAESTWVDEARKDLARALSDTGLTEAQRQELVAKSARTMKEYGQAPGYPKGDTGLEILYRGNYEAARRELEWTNDLYKVFNERLLDQQLKLINSMQIEVVERQIKLIIPGRGVVELSGEVIGTIFGANIAEGINNGQYADAKGLAARFRAMAETKNLVRKLALAKQTQLLTVQRLQRDLQNVGAMEDRLRRQYQTTYNSTFTFRGYETSASERGMDSAGAAPAPTAQASRCSCEDWNKDGLYGVVLDGKAIAPNVGTYNECKRHSQSIPACAKGDDGSGSAQAGPCSCEDWDKDGRYGVVLDGKAIAPNIGSYDECKRYARGMASCAKAEDKAKQEAKTNRCSCEDWDKDGRYGVVLDGKAIAPNIGSYNECRRYAQSMGRCKSAR